jgi:uncharacterized protein (DUF1786 family)
VAAAILGVSCDVQLKGKDPVMVLAIATSHTVVAVLSEGQAAGFVVYQTRDLALARFEERMVKPADGAIDHGAIIAQGGHAAWLRKGLGAIQFL